MRLEKGDLFIADDRTAWISRNGVRTVKKMFMTSGECSSWVAKRNAEVEKLK